MMSELSWLRIDERSDVVSSLNECSRALAALREDDTAWKWAVVALHNALQGAMVCHLSGTAQMGAMSEDSVVAWLAWHDRDIRGEIKWIEEGTTEFGIPSRRPATRADEPPRLYMAKPRDLFRRLHRADKRLEVGVGAVLEISAGQGWAFRKLNFLRNEFIHFTPKGWSLELSGMPQIFRDILEVVDLIVSDPWPFWHCSNEERAELRQRLDELRGHSQLN